jgi:hypothetical protein
MGKKINWKMPEGYNLGAENENENTPNLTD